MAKIKLAEGGFQLLPEGTTTFKIVEVEYDEDFGKMKVSLQTKNGQKHTEQFSLLKNTGEVNEGALKAFSYLAKTALNNFNLNEIDEQDLVGCYITATVKHESYETTNKKTGEQVTRTAARLNDYAVAVGFGSNVSKIEEEPKEEETEDVDLDDFLA